MVLLDSRLKRSICTSDDLVAMFQGLIMSTVEVSNNLWGDKLYQQRARKAFPFLVRQALIGTPIYYSDLAEEVGMPNERNLNYVLGCIGTTILELSNQKNEDIPPIQCLVINKSTKLPGEGIGWFISKADFKKLDTKQKRIVVNGQLSKVYSYPCWLELLDELGLNPPDFPAPIMKKSIGTGGEGEAHKQLKEFVANNPTVVGLPLSCPKGEAEFNLHSGDSVDVVFSWRNELIAVEVKSGNSDMGDIHRGLYQCVKYQAVLEAMLGIQGKPKNVRTLLLLEGSFPEELVSTKNMLGIDVLSNITVKS